MDVKTSAIKFTYLKGKCHGQVCMFRPSDKLMVRVYVSLEKNKEQVFGYYKLKKDELF